MARRDKTLEQVLSGRRDANIRFNDLRRLLLRLGFTERIRGDHYIFGREGMTEILNLQPRGSQSKPYQVKQVRDIILKYGLGGSDDD